MAEEIILATALSRDLLPRGAKNQPVAVRLKLFTHDDFVRAHPQTTCDVVLAVDTSQSMDDPFKAGSSLTKREGVIKAATAMVSALNPDDTLSLVCFDSGAYIEFNRTPGREKQTIQQAIAAKICQHSGGTNFEVAFDRVKSLLTRPGNPSRRVCFLTDGNQRHGSAKRAAELNREIAALGAVVDCLGVGGDFHFTEMQKYTAESNGRTELLDTPEEAQRIFRDLLRNAQQSLIANAVLRFTLAPHVRDVVFYQLTPEIRVLTPQVQAARDGSRSCRINLQTMAQNFNYTYVLCCNVDVNAGPRDANLPLGRIRLDYDVPVSKLTGQVIENTFVLNVADKPGEETHDHTVEQDALEASLEQLNQEAQSASDRNDWKRVAAILKQMIAHARTLGDTDKRKVYEQRLDALVANGQLTRDDLNRIGNASTKSTRLRGGQREARNDPIY